MKDRTKMDEVIREFYPMEGPNGCHERLDGMYHVRTIARRAAHIGVGMDPAKKSELAKAKSDWVTKGWDDIIRKHYANEGTEACAERIGHKTARQVSYRAKLLGVKVSKEARQRNASKGRRNGIRQLATDRATFGDALSDNEYLALTGRKRNG